ncbi:MAG: hypothetical protein WDW36_007644 [Sanguina aurantia]
MNRHDFNDTHQPPTASICISPVGAPDVLLRPVTRQGAAGSPLRKPRLASAMSATTNSASLYPQRSAVSSLNFARNNALSSATPSRTHSTHNQGIGLSMFSLAARASSMLPAPARAGLSGTDIPMVMDGFLHKSRRTSILRSDGGVLAMSSPPLNPKHGSLCSYLYAPHPVAGKGLSFSPDGNLLVRFGYGADVLLINASDGTLSATLANPSQGSVRFATFSADSRLLASASDDCCVQVWEVASGVNVGSICAGEEAVSFCVLSRDGARLLSCNDEGKLQLWSVATGQAVVVFDQVNQAARACSFGVDDSYVVSCSGEDCSVTLLDSSTGGIIFVDSFEEVCDADGVHTTNHPVAAMFARQQTAAGWCQPVLSLAGAIVCDMESKRRHRRMQASAFGPFLEGRSSVNYVISSDGGKVIVYLTEQCYSLNLVLYDTTSQDHTQLYVCDGSVTHVEFSSDAAFFVTSGRDNFIHVWDAANGSLLNTLGGHSTDVMYCKVSADGNHVISGDNGGTVLCWDLIRGASSLKLQGHQAPVAYCDLSTDRTRAITVDGEGHAYLWFLDIQRVFEVLRECSDMLCSVQFDAPRSRIMAGYSDGCVKCWDTDSVSVTWVHEQHGCAVQCMGLTASGAILASSGRNGRVLLTDTASGGVLGSVMAHDRPVIGLSFIEEDATLISAGREGVLAMWNVQMFGPLPVLTLTPPGSPEITHLGVSASGKYVSASCSNGMAFVWESDTADLIHELLVTDLACTFTIISEDIGRIFCGSADGSTSTYDLHTGSRVSTLLGNASAVTLAMFVAPPPKAPATPARPPPSNDPLLVTVCGRQAISWDIAAADKTATADFVSDRHALFDNSILEGRTFVNHTGVAMFDPALATAVYDMFCYDTHPGNSYLLRNATISVPLGPHSLPAILFSPPDKTVHMLATEAAGVKSLDFSSDGHYLVSGSIRGELAIYDVEHHVRLHFWVAHKRAAITCVKFTHDGSAVYSCGEDCKVIMWDWRTMGQIALLSGHLSPVTSVEMSMDGQVMASGDKEGFIFVWDTSRNQPTLRLQVHQGPVLCCSISPDGTKVASSGADEHIVITDAATGLEIMSLDTAMEGKGTTIKFSFDGTRVQVGGENGSVLVWDVQQDCLLFDIPAHEGKVWDCSWSGDSRRLLSVGSDGQAKLWDTTAGSELVKGDFEKVLGAVELGGLLRCDLSSDGSVMAGATSKGQLILWELDREFRKEPDGSMLYKWLASMPLSKARHAYKTLLESYPLLMNAQDGRGWSVLMHAAVDSNPEITKLIISCIPAKSGQLGLTASALQTLPGAHRCSAGGSYGHRAGVTNGSLRSKQDKVYTLSDRGSLRLRSQSSKGGGPSAFKSLRSAMSMKFRSDALSPVGPAWACVGGRLRGPVTGARKVMQGRLVAPCRLDGVMMSRGVMRAMATRPSGSVDADHVLPAWFAPRLAAPPRVARARAQGSQPAPLDAGTTSAVPMKDTATLVPVDALEEPNAVRIALQGNSVECVQHMLAAVLSEKVTRGSYRSITHAITAVSQTYPSMCEAFLTGLPLTRLGEMEVPSKIGSTMVVRSANSYTSYKEMWTEQLRLGEGGKGPMVIMEAYMVLLPRGVSVSTYGTPTIKAIIDFKWDQFARAQIYTKTLIYMLFVVTFTAFAVMSSKDTGTVPLMDILEDPLGRATVAFSVVLFLYGLYYFCLEVSQLRSMGFRSYFMSFWNFMDVASYVANLIICPCYIFRYGLGPGGFTPVLVSLEVILLWMKVTFFALAVDGVGTFIFVTIEIIKGMRFFILLLCTLFLSFGVAFMVLFRNCAIDSAVDPLQYNTLSSDYANFGVAMLSSSLVVLGQSNPRDALGSEWPAVATIIYCLYVFLIVVILLNMLISLMSGIFQRVSSEQIFVFLHGRAELIIEVESTEGITKLPKIQPYLHILMPTVGGTEGDNGAENATNKIVAAVLARMAMPDKVVASELSIAALSAVAGASGDEDGDRHADSDADGDDSDGDGSAASGKTVTTVWRGGRGNGGRRKSNATGGTGTSIHSYAPSAKNKMDAFSRQTSIRSVKFPAGLTLGAAIGMDRPTLARNHTLRETSAAQHQRTSFAGAAGFNVTTNRQSHAGGGGGSTVGAGMGGGGGGGAGGGGGGLFAIERTLALLNHKVDALSTRMQLNISSSGAHDGAGGGHHGGGGWGGHLPPVRPGPTMGGLGRSNSSRAGGGGSLAMNGLIGTVKGSGGGAMTNRAQGGGGGRGGLQAQRERVQFGSGENDGGEDGRRVYVGSDPVASAAALLRRAQSAGLRRGAARFSDAPDPDTDPGQERASNSNSMMDRRRTKSLMFAEADREGEDSGSDRALTDSDDDDGGGDTEDSSSEEVGARAAAHTAAWGERPSGGGARAEPSPEAARGVSPVPAFPHSALRHPAAHRAGLHEAAAGVHHHTSGGDGDRATHRRVDPHPRPSDARELAAPAAHPDRHTAVSHHPPLRSQHSVGFPDAPASPRAERSSRHVAGGSSNVSSRRTSNTSTHHSSNMGPGVQAHHPHSSAAPAAPAAAAAAVTAVRHAHRESPGAATHTDPHSPRGAAGPAALRLRALLPVEAAPAAAGPDPPPALPLPPVKPKSVGFGMVLGSGGGGGGGGGGELGAQLDATSAGAAARSRGLHARLPQPAEACEPLLGGGERTSPSVRPRVGFTPLGGVHAEAGEAVGAAQPKRALGGAMRGSRRALVEPRGLCVVVPGAERESPAVHGVVSPAAHSVTSPVDLGISFHELPDAARPVVASANDHPRGGLVAGATQPQPASTSASSRPGSGPPGRT